MAIFLKKAPMNKLLLTNRTPATTSKITGGTYWRFTWVDMDTGEQYETTVDSTMRNFSAWQALVSKPNPYGVYTGLHLVRRNTTHNRVVATADQVPVLIDSVNSQAESYALHKSLKNKQRSQTSTFHNLFTRE